MRKQSIGMPNRAAWVERPMGEVCDVISRGTAPVYVEHSFVSVIGQRCIRNSGFDAAPARKHNSRILKVLRAQSGDVLLNSTGTGTIGRSCVFKENGDFIVDGHVTVLRTAPAQADPRWINAVLRSPWGRQYLESHCYTGSTNQIELSRAELIRTSIPIPLIAEQRRIVEILDAVDEQLVNQRRYAEKAKIAYLGLIDQAVHSLTEQGSLRRNSLAELVSQGEIVLGRGNIISQKDIDLTPGPYPIYSSSSASDGVFGSYGKYMFDEELITWSVDGGGRLFYRRPHRFSITNVCGYLRVLRNDRWDCGYLFASLESQWRRTTFDWQFKAHPSVIDQLYCIPFIPLQRQRQISVLVRKYKPWLAEIKSSVGKLENLKQALVDDLLTGRVRVPFGAAG